MNICSNRRCSVYSLRNRLLLWISIPILLAGLISLLIGFLFSWHEIEEVYDAQMAHSAKLLLQIAEYEFVEQKNDILNLGEETELLSHKYESKIAFRIWYHDKLLTRSWNTDDFKNIEATPGFSDLDVSGKPWRFFVFIDEKAGIKIEIAQRYAIRYELIGQFMISLIAPLLVFIPLIILIIWVGVRNALRPVIRVSHDVDRRNSDDLSPIQPGSIPQEIAPLITALNRLFSRIDGSFRREREFTDYAAHELRTPLAAMKTQTQVLMKKAKAMPECAEGLVNLQSSIDRGAHLVDQLLLLARLQNEKIPKHVMDLSLCIKDAILDVESQGKEKKVMVETSVSDGIRIIGDPDAIRILVRNLLDNAVKYTPEGGHVTVRLSEEGSLDISDTGPGLSDEDKARVFERFVRVDKTGQTGSGLGLSIAQWIAQAHGIEIMLGDNIPHGLVIHIQWDVLS